MAVGGITRNVTRIRTVAMLPAAPFGKVARCAPQGQVQCRGDLNQPGASSRTLAAPTASCQNLKNAQVSSTTRTPRSRPDRRGQGDVMITETYEALHYAGTEPRLAAAFTDAAHAHQLLRLHAAADDADYQRVMNFVWELLTARHAEYRRPALRRLSSLNRRHRREESHFGTIRQGRAFLGHVLVQRQADRLAARQRIAMRATTRDQFVTQGRQRRCAGDHALTGAVQRLADRGEVAHGDLLHASSSDSGMKRTRSPATMVLPAG